MSAEREKKRTPAQALAAVQRDLVGKPAWVRRSKLTGALRKLFGPGVVATVAEYSFAGAQEVAPGVWVASPQSTVRLLVGKVSVIVPRGWVDLTDPDAPEPEITAQPTMPARRPCW